MIEQVFALPGIGRLIVQGILARDYPLVQGCILLIAVTYVAVNVIVDLAYRHQLGRRAGHEDLVGNEQLGAGDVAFDHRVTEVTGDLDDALAADAFKNRSGQRRRGDLPVANHEDVLARSFADEVVLVQKNRLLVAGIVRLDLRQHRVEVLPRCLGLRDEAQCGDGRSQGCLQVIG